jgi:hypothetical protein
MHNLGYIKWIKVDNADYLLTIPLLQCDCINVLVNMVLVFILGPELHQRCQFWVLLL